MYMTRIRVLVGVFMLTSLSGCVGYYHPYGHSAPEYYGYRSYQTHRPYRGHGEHWEHNRGYGGHGSYRRHHDDD